mmetsp:Transcript_74293/g.176999  ORF Transcript_74293/g.176999 Transcript_74293/m.176999 type:complete len:231 (-) Transcript_74293:230-922(-)
MRLWTCFSRKVPISLYMLVGRQLRDRKRKQQQEQMLCARQMLVLRLCPWLGWHPSALWGLVSGCGAHTSAPCHEATATPDWRISSDTRQRQELIGSTMVSGPARTTSRTCCRGSLALEAHLVEESAFATCHVQLTCMTYQSFVAGSLAATASSLSTRTGLPRRMLLASALLSTGTRTACTRACSPSWMPSALGHETPAFGQCRHQAHLLCSARISTTAMSRPSPVLLPRQ